MTKKRAWCKVSAAKKLLLSLRTRSQGVLFAAFAPLADITNSPKLQALYDSDQNLVTYINSLFKIAISIGAIIAVVKLGIAGYMYMGGDMWHTKEKAKDTIRDVFFGLFLLLSIFLILKQINPNLLKLDVRLPTVTFSPPMPAPGAGTTPSGTRECTLCVPIPSGILSKPPGTVPATSACRAYGGPCLVSPTMASKLQNFSRALSSASSFPAWQITEAYPPTVPHSGLTSCHNNGSGTCIDANFLSGADATPRNIHLFQGAASQAGLTASWEVGSQARMEQLRAAGVGGPILVVPPPPGTTKAEHFHITGG